MSQCSAETRFGPDTLYCVKEAGHGGVHRNGSLAWGRIEAEEQEQAREKDEALLVTLTAAALTGLLASPHTSELSQSDLVALAVSHALAMRAALHAQKESDHA